MAGRASTNMHDNIKDRNHDFEMQLRGTRLPVVLRSCATAVIVAVVVIVVTATVESVLMSSRTEFRSQQVEDLFLPEFLEEVIDHFGGVVAAGQVPDEF